MTHSIHNLPPNELGKRLRIAREKVDITQADAARSVKLSRTTLVAIEKGDRSVKDGELISLSDLYGVRINEILRKEAVHVDLIPRFRKLNSDTEQENNSAISLLNDFVTAEIELEAILGIERISSLPQERALSGDVRKQAETDALSLRKVTGLGIGPIKSIFNYLELDLGIRIYSHPLKNHISGLFAYDDDVGACILINSSHRYERQVLTSAHELGHVITARKRPDICHEGYQQNSREERYANAFAPALLMPKDTVLRKLSEIRAGSKNLTRRHVIILAHYFGVSREGFVKRLETLNAAPDGAWDWFQRNGGITDDQVKEVLGSDAFELERFTYRLVPTSVRLETLASQALERGLLSEGQVSELLKIDRTKVRRLILEGGNGEYDDQLSFV